MLNLMSEAHFVSMLTTEANFKISKLNVALNLALTLALDLTLTPRGN